MMKLLLLVVSLLLIAICQSGMACWERQRAPDRPPVSGGDGSLPIRVSGRIQLNPPVVLPANSRVVVQLQDISLADAPSKLLAKKTITAVADAFNANGNIPFTIEAAVPASTPFLPNSVSVSASVKGDGVSYFTDTAYFVELASGTFEYKDLVITLVKYPSA